MACSNCFNGCADIVSDQCVKYTGIDIPGLGISNGDPLLVVENKITEKIQEIMTGAGIIPVVDQTQLCLLVSSFLPCCDATTITLNDVISALIRSICNLDGRVNIAQEQLNLLNANYVIGCLAGVTVTSDTHQIVQSIITKLCQTVTDLATLEADVFANYVLISDIDDYITSYLAGQPISTVYNSKMIPYVAVAYFGPLTGPGAGNGFDLNGAGFGVWDRVFLCNGVSHPNTPDLRGLIVVGATTMGPPPFKALVDPTIAGNHTYAVNEIHGTNTVPLTLNQIPNHDHSTTVLINEPAHKHTVQLPVTSSEDLPESGGVDITGNAENQFYLKDSSSNTIGLKGGDGTTVTVPPQNVFVTVGKNGGGAAHPNVQPGIGAYYIMYIP